MLPVALISKMFLPMILISLSNLLGSRFRRGRSSRLFAVCSVGLRSSANARSNSSFANTPSKLTTIPPNTRRRCAPVVSRMTEVEKTNFSEQSRGRFNYLRTTPAEGAALNNNAGNLSSCNTLLRRRRPSSSPDDIASPLKCKRASSHTHSTGLPTHEILFTLNFFTLLP